MESNNLFAAKVVASFDGAAWLKETDVAGTYSLSCSDSGPCVDFYDDGRAYVYTYGWYFYDVVSGRDPNKPNPDNTEFSANPFK